MTRLPKIGHILYTIPTLRDKTMQFAVTATRKPDYLEDRVSVGDSVNYELDFSPWLEGKGTITNTTWVNNNGNASVVSTDQSALISCTSKGKSVVSCLVETSTGEAKKVWIILLAGDMNGVSDYDM